MLGMGAREGRSQGAFRIGLLVAVAALFALIPASQASAASFTLEIVQNGSGEGEVRCYVEPAEVDCEEEFEEGEEVTLVAEAEAGSEFVGWGAGECQEEPSETECVVTMDANRNVTATFALEPTERNLTVKATGAGKVVCEAEEGLETCKPTYPKEQEVTLYAVPASGSEFLGWAGDCSGKAESCVLEMSADRVVTASFSGEGGGGKEGSGGGGSPSSNVKSPPPPNPAPGKAKIGGAGLYKGGKATLRISCKGGGPCKGTVKLVAKLKVGGKQKKLTVAKAPFSLAANASRALVVKLSAPAKNLLAKGKMLIAKVGGSGVTPSTVKINPTER